MGKAGMSLERVVKQRGECGVQGGQGWEPSQKDWI